jgi:hypothetical protein
MHWARSANVSSLLSDETEGKRAERGLNILEMAVREEGNLEERDKERKNRSNRTPKLCLLTLANAGRTNAFAAPAPASCKGRGPGGEN